MFGGMMELSVAGVGCSMGAFEGPGDERLAQVSGCGRMMGVSWYQACLSEVLCQGGWGQ